MSVYIYTECFSCEDRVSSFSCSAIMNLKVVFAVVLLSALAITFTHAGIPKCCIRIKKNPIDPRMKVERWERQYSNGACDIDALIVYVKNKTTPLCVHPKQEARLLKITKLRKLRRHLSREV
ncbi:uncharacterized protein ccl27b [Fundulus heteroclitus]|uniref:uncharacterized protein ccl27b n=1 Tax=Fundulus heteroclitus TaxID=8078 RepID=UPI00165CD8FC|nr:uncharacterized protein ccl27b [Fundulus heteroclitus]